MGKVCLKCNIEKEFTEFSKRRTSRDGYQSHCKKCTNQYNKQYRIKNKEQIKEGNKQYYIKNKEQIKEHQKQYVIKNKEQLKEYEKQYYIKNREQKKEYRIKNKEQKKEYDKQYCIKNREQKKEYNRDRYKTDPLYALKRRIRSLIRKSLINKGYTKKSKTHEILGIGYVELKEYMERQFTKGMNWENRDRWHIDHIIPLATAHCEDDVIRLNHYTNLQPLWAYDNLSKGSKIL